VLEFLDEFIAVSDVLPVERNNFVTGPQGSCRPTGPHDAHYQMANLLFDTKAMISRSGGYLGSEKHVGVRGGADEDHSEEESNQNNPQSHGLLPA
jgi:hypothetical protein